jgi:hypothetical protein
MEHALIRAMEKAFRLRGWQWESVAGALVVQTVFEAHHTRVPVHVQGFPEIHGIQAVGYAGHEVPAARSGVVAELLMRVNQQLAVGNFELDYDLGRVLFRAANVFASDDAADPTLIGGLVHACIVELDRMAPLLTEILSMSVDELSRLNLRLFVLREDHLPPVQGDT